MTGAAEDSDSRARADRLAGEQAALRRIATLVARGTAPRLVFRAVADEVVALLGCDTSAIIRFEPDGRMTAVGGHRAQRDVGERFVADPDYVLAAVRDTGRAARFDTADPTAADMPEPVRREGIRSGLASPVMVHGELWGVITVASLTRPLPASTDRQLDDFTELVATAVSNAQAQEEIRRLADEQAALRRVATLVAEGGSPAAVFDAVAAEMAALLRADGITLARYEPGDEYTVVAHRGAGAATRPPGTRVPERADSVSAIVRRRRRPARADGHEPSRFGVGAPIVVQGRIWGAIIASWTGDEPPAAGTEERMAQFTELMDTAIANADSRDQLMASRARLVTTADEARRRVVRDLHDGAQQRLVHTIVSLKLAERALDEGKGDVASLMHEALQHAERANAELRELAHGILPSALTVGGLRGAVSAVVERLEVPVEVRVPGRRFRPELEASAYFIIAEALTNVVKHARAQRAEVNVEVDDGTLRIDVRDDGIGGADPGGHGLVGIGDRVTAMGGRLSIDSRRGGGTIVAATLPLDSV